MCVWVDGDSSGGTETTVGLSAVVVSEADCLAEVMALGRAASRTDAST